MIEGESEEELDQRTRELVNVFQNDLECEAIVEEDIGLGLFFNTLPLSYSPEADLSSQRYIRILRSDAVNFIPIFDSFRGLDRPLQLFLSRENNLVKFSLEENETCPPDTAYARRNWPVRSRSAADDPSCSRWYSVRKGRGDMRTETADWWTLTT